LEKAQQTAQEFGIPRAYGSYDDVLADPEIDAVYIPLPNDLHCEWTLRALHAGKHVLCDKPAALTLSDATQMSNAAEVSQRLLMEGFMWRHHPQHARVAALLATGEIGELRHFRGAFTYPSTPDPSNIRWQKEKGGGALLDVGVYPVNAARYFVGEEPISVSAYARWDNETGVDTHTVALLEFPNGITVSVLGGFDQAFTTKYELIGTKGSITAERAFQVGEVGVDLTIRVGDETRTEHFPHVDQYGEEIDHFSRLIQSHSDWLYPAEDGVSQAKVVEALCRSLAKERRVTLSEI
jgi:predicted dehydrogenase